MTDVPFLRVKGISRHYPVFEGGFFKTQTGVIRAVENVSFDLAAGSSLVVLGEPGAGKTTLARLLARLEQPDSGRIFIQEREVSQLRGQALRALRQQVQYVYPDPRRALNSRQTLLQSLEEPLHQNRVQDAAYRRERLETLCGALRINAHLLRKRPAALSTALLQRVAIARALALRPVLLICDGPGDGLETRALRSLLDDLRALQRTAGFGLIWTARHPDRVRGLAESALVLYRGRGVEWGPADLVVQNPQHPYARRWLGQSVPAEPEPQPYQRGCRFHPECPQTMPVCREEAPGMWAVQPDHRVACHLYEQGFG